MEKAMAEDMKTKKVLVELVGEQVDQMEELIRRDGSSAAAVMRKAISILYAQRETAMPVVVNP